MLLSSFVQVKQAAFLKWPPLRKIRRRYQSKVSEDSSNKTVSVTLDEKSTMPGRPLSGGRGEY